VIRFLAVIAALVTTAQAWDLAGHQLVGEIAWLNCTPEVRAKVEALVAKLDTSYNGGRTYNFTTANAFLDDQRSRPHYEWGRLHYVDLPKTDDGAAFALPEPPHVVAAIEDAIKALRDPQTPENKQAEALAILMHCTGDVHQPLHACTWDDRGGNGYLVGGVAFADLYKGGKGNLHAFWDEAYRVKAQDGKIVESFITPPITSRVGPGEPGIIATTAVAITRQFPTTSLAKEINDLNPTDWARESHILGCTKAYPPGPHPTNYEVRTLTPEFGTAAQKIAVRRIALAGYRLARVLSDLFGKS